MVRCADYGDMPTLGVYMKSEIQMRPKRGIRNRVGNRKGNVMLEFALCYLPLLGMFFGIIDVSFVVFLKSMIQSGVRDGVRFGITYQTSIGGASCGSVTQCTKKVVQDVSLGFLNASNANLVEVNYYAPTNLSTPITAADCDPSGSRTMAGDTQVPPRQLRYVNQPGNLIEVRVVDFPWNWIVPIPGLLNSPSTKMSASATDVLQGLPVGTVVPPAP